ncbi:MAG: 16S rRNA (guanine(527)-N(7))-methyltransferase RsmG [Hyphomicrobiales bacterium]|nr:16S rRNA (guanine(527)-N(7))-methyltransferase RsmG [Hyphomicrobiales bacterium]
MIATSLKPRLDLSADRAEALRLTPVSRETEARLDRYVEVLLAWNAKTNLIAASTVPRLWTRHIADSLQLLDLAPRQARIWVDFGSGAGFPGAVLACALADRPGSAVHLVESNGKKAAFLREAARITGIPAIIHAERVEAFVSRWHSVPDVVTARALASLKLLLDQSFNFIAAGALGLFPKGADVEAELTEATQFWNIRVNLAPSRTDPKARIVMVRALRPRTQGRSRSGVREG